MCTGVPGVCAGVPGMCAGVRGMCAGVPAGADPEFFCEGGQRGGALIIMVWAWLRNIARKRGRCTQGLGLRPSRFLLLSCYFGAFSLYLYHQGDVRHRPL